ncbi:MAG: PepSY domain-containing protein [Sphingomonadales bacterium]
MRVSILSTKIHKWIGLVVGLQVILWVAGGLVMSWFPIEQVRGEHNIAEQKAEVLTASDNLVPISQVLSQLDGADALRVELRHLMGQPVYAVTLAEGQPKLVNARTAALLTPLTADFARRIALADFKGEAGVLSVRLLEETNSEYRRALPVWQVLLDDEEDTHLYVSPFTGKIVGRRNAVWRFYDFFWMLHIMDYENRSDFNNPLLIWASIIALVLSITGLVLLFYRFSKRDFRWLAFRRRQRKLS